jgi:hypothetical protein
MSDPVIEADRKRAARILALLKIVLETVEEAGEEGAPSGPMYAALQTAGVSLEAYESIVQFLIDKKAIRKSNHVLYFQCNIFKENDL